jgi:hypothetical protein
VNNDRLVVFEVILEDDRFVESNALRFAESFRPLDGVKREYFCLWKGEGDGSGGGLVVEIFTGRFLGVGSLRGARQSLSPGFSRRSGEDSLDQHSVVLPDVFHSEISASPTLFDFEIVTIDPYLRF